MIKLFGSRKTVEKLADIKPFPAELRDKALNNINELPPSPERIKNADGSELPISFSRETVFSAKISIRTDLIPALKNGAGEKDVKAIEAEIEKLRQKISNLEAERNDIIAVVNALKPGTYPS